MEARAQLKMDDFRAKLGMIMDKSGTEPSLRTGLCPRVLQAVTQARSKVWPVETITGSAMSDPEIGHMNSVGGFGFRVSGLPVDL